MLSKIETTKKLGTTIKGALVGRGASSRIIAGLGFLAFQTYGSISIDLTLLSQLIGGRSLLGGLYNFENARMKDVENQEDMNNTQMNI